MPNSISDDISGSSLGSTHDLIALGQIFETQFGTLPTASGFSPGRVNLIGEHTDYNGGYVLPTALSLGISLAMRPRDDNLVRVWSESFDGVATRTLDESARDHWSDYALGTAILAKAQGLTLAGMDVVMRTDLPFGAGLSSSAALTVGLLKLADTKGALSERATAKLARRVENEFIGMPCGIMDQMAIAMAQPGQALALDTASLEVSLITLPSEYHMVVIHSGQYRRLSEGRYKVRKQECDAVKAALGHDGLCTISDAELASLSHLDTRLQRRARHCMSEHRRTVSACEALRMGKMQSFGALMIESHVSMRDDFEISLPVIDALVGDAVKFGALGARMTGGGFGGCIVACVPKEKLLAWRERLLQDHTDAVFVC